MTTDVAVGSPEATPKVNGSTGRSTSGTEPVDSDVEHAVMTTVAPSARNARRDNGGSRGEIMSKVCQSRRWSNDRWHVKKVNSRISP